MKKFPWVHFTGIAGVATGQLAVEYKKNGWLVSGSDKGLFPPMSTHIENNGINIEIGYKSEHLEVEYYHNKYKGDWTKREYKYPDLIVYQGAKGTKNEEYISAVNNNIPIKNYPEILQGNVLLKESSIVVSGTYGKTTTTAMLAHTLTQSNVDVSFMFGGLNDNLKNGVRFKNQNTKYSIIEGDEYIISTENRISKFFLYSPKYLILTSAQWDHSDIFATKDDYLENFAKLVGMVPKDGVIIYNGKDENVLKLVRKANCEIINYSNEPIEMLKLSVLGEYNIENAKAVISLLKYLGIDEDKIFEGLKSFSGIQRRLEIKYKNQDDLQIIIDDFGASPSKANSALDSIAKVYPEHKIVAIFEPNLGSRTKEILGEYKTTFAKRNSNLLSVFLPRFTKVQGEFLTNQDLADYLKEQNVDVYAIDEDDEILKRLTKELNQPKTIIIFLGSHGFRGMIDMVCNNL